MAAYAIWLIDDDPIRPAGIATMLAQLKYADGAFTPVSRTYRKAVKEKSMARFAES